MKQAQYVVVCLDCGGEVVQKFSGDEGWGICQECGAVEGDTEEITVEEYDERVG